MRGEQKWNEKQVIPSGLAERRRLVQPSVAFQG